MNVKLILPAWLNPDQITSKSSLVLTEYLRIVTYCSVLQLSTWLAELTGTSTKLFQWNSFLLVTHAMSCSIKWQYKELSCTVPWNFFLCSSHYSAEECFSMSTIMLQSKEEKESSMQLGLNSYFSEPESPSLPKRINPEGSDMINRKYMALQSKNQDIYWARWILSLRLNYKNEDN